MGDTGAVSAVVPLPGEIVMSVYNGAEPVWFTALLHLEARPGHMQLRLDVHPVRVPVMETLQGTSDSCWIKAN